MLDRITPLILTYNEAPNIGRTLSRLSWANRIVIVDSYSDDETVEIARGFSAVEVFQRRFDRHLNQWIFGLRQTGITTDWVLALDADYVLTDDLTDEISSIDPATRASGFEVRFRYLVLGKPIRSSLYPRLRVLFRRDRVHYEQSGHNPMAIIDGEVGRLNGWIHHDDRKPISRWLDSQLKYALQESERLANSNWKELSWRNRIRKVPGLAPMLVAFYCLVLKRGILDGKPGLYYAAQRALYETLLQLTLLDRILRG